MGALFVYTFFNNFGTTCFGLYLVHVGKFCGQRQVHFLIRLGPLWSQFLIKKRNRFRDHCWTILKQVWDHFGNMLANLWDHLGTMLGPFWERSTIRRKGKNLPKVAKVTEVEVETNMRRSIWPRLFCTVVTTWRHWAPRHIFIIWRRALFG